MTSTVLPAWARAAATLTVVVVFPTPPFWLATVMTRVRAGRGTARPLSVIRRRASAATAAAKGVCPSAPGIAAAIWARSSVSSCVGASMRSSRVPAEAGGASVRWPVSDALSSLWCTSGSDTDVSRETRSAAGQPSGVVGGPDRRGKPRPGAAVRVSATPISVLTPSPSLRGRTGQSNLTGGQHAKAPRQSVDNRVPSGRLWTTGPLWGGRCGGRLATGADCRAHQQRRGGARQQAGPERAGESCFT